MPSYEFHPAAEYFPLHTPEEFAALVMSLQRYGFDPTHPIVLCDDIILDGRNRYRACQELGIEALLTTYVGNPYIKVWRENAARRELAQGQKAAIYLQMQMASEEWSLAQHHRQAAIDVGLWPAAHSRRTCNARR
jgi:hypothetical protein